MKGVLSLLKSMLFAALFLNGLGLYLARQHTKYEQKNISRTFFQFGIATFFIIFAIPILSLFLSEDLFPLFLWTIIIISALVECYSLITQLVYGQLFAISLLLTLVVPTIFSVGLYLLITSIILLIIAFITFFHTKKYYIH